jgi:hypothetical protein
MLFLMKPKLLLPFLGILFYGNLHATHYRSGEITYKIIGNLQIEATVITYTKVSGTSILADRDTIVIDWGDRTGGVLPRTNGPVVGNYPNGVMVTWDTKMNVYTGQHTYSGSNAYYILSFYDQNRLAGINDISGGNSVDVPFYVMDSVYMADVAVNSSPILLNPPIYYAAVGDTFKFNPVAYDADGDSLDFVLLTPLQNQGNPVLVYLFPEQYCVVNGEPTCTFKLNPQSGQLTWATPCQQGIFDIAFVVKEFRCGNLIGTVERDMQIVVLAELNHPPQLNSLRDTIIQPGQSIQFNVLGTDIDLGQVDSLQMFGGPFLAAHDTPTFVSTPGNAATGTFSWTPDTSFAREQPYIFTLQARDNYLINGNSAGLMNCQTFRVWVADTSVVPCFALEAKDISKSDFLMVYPNPLSSDNLFIDVNDDLMGSEINIYDDEGRMLYKSEINSLHSEIELNLAKGIYLLRLSSSNGNAVKKLVKL